MGFMGFLGRCHIKRLFFFGFLFVFLFVYFCVGVV
jgi:hypothetical protein